MCLGNLSHIFFWHKAINAGLPHVLENYACPGMSLRSPGKTQFFRFCLKCRGKVLECLWSMEFVFPWQSFSDQLAIFKSPPTLWWWRLIVFSESARRRHLFLLSLENPYSDYCILALGNLPGKFFLDVFPFLFTTPNFNTLLTL